MHPLRPLFFLLSLLAFSHTQTIFLAESSSHFDIALQTLQKEIGYEFVAVDLLRQAMTHASYSIENNRALAALGLYTTEASAALRTLQADIDASAESINSCISEVSAVEACAAAGERLGLQKVVRVSRKTNSSEPTVVCSAFRAIFGAVAIDTGKIDAAGEVFWRVHGGASASASASASV